MRTEKYMSLDGEASKLAMVLSNGFGFYTSWVWQPKSENSIWGFIYQQGFGYLTLDGCMIDEICTIRANGYNGGLKQQWRILGNKVVSKEVRKNKPLLLTLDSNQNIIARAPHTTENQEWLLLKSGDCLLLS